MRFVRLGVAGCSILLLGALAPSPSPVGQSTSTTKSTPLILSPSAGEQRHFLNRSGTFTLKVDPLNGGSEHVVLFTEGMSPGDRIPTHRHPLADELIIIQSGTGKVTLGDQVQEAHAGTVVFIPRNTWISMDNIGKDKLTHTDVFSSPGYEQYLRSISVPEVELPRFDGQVV